MGNIDQLPLVREGTYLYAQSVPVRVRIVASPETWGTGDYQDKDAIAENQDNHCFFVLYEMAGKPGEFCNVVPNVPTLEAAYEFCGEKFPNIQWQVAHVRPSFTNAKRSCPGAREQLPLQVYGNETGTGVDVLVAGQGVSLHS